MSEEGNHGYFQQKNRDPAACHGDGQHRKSTERMENGSKAVVSAVITTGKEYYEAAQINAENDITFKMLYSRKIHEMKPSEIRIIYNGKAYDVKRITDYREQRRTLEIKAVEINGRD